MEDIRKVVLIILVSVILVGFFLPWVQVESQHVGAISKMLTGKHQASLGGISGFQVPLQANSSESRLAISVIKIFAPNIEHADKKSFAVYVFPVLAILIFFACHFYGKIKWVHAGVAVLGIAIFGVGLFKIVTMDMNKIVLNVRIGVGLWAILVGYLGIGVLEAVNFIKIKDK